MWALTFFLLLGLSPLTSLAQDSKPAPDREPATQSEFSQFPSQVTLANLPSTREAPRLSMQRAFRIADEFIEKEKIDVTNCYLFSVDLHRDEVNAEPLWRFFWVGLHKGGSIAPDIWIAVTMDGIGRRYDPNSGHSLRY